MRFSGISGCLSAAVLALGVGGAPVVQADALGDSLEQAHIRKATFAAPAWEGYTNADGSGLYWDLLKQVYAPYGLDVKFINMPWNRANKLMTAGSMVDGVPGEIPGVEGKLYAQLPIDIEYHGVMHAAKTPFSGRASLTGKRVGWRHSYNLIPAEQRDFTLVECVRPERCTEQVQNGELDFFLDEPDELEKQRSEAHLPADAYPIAQLPPGKESFMTFADSASGRLLRESTTRGYGRWRRPASCGRSTSAGTARCPAPCRLFRRSDAPLISIAKPFRGLRGGNETPRIRPSFPPLTHRKGGYIDDSVLYPLQAAPGLTATETYRSTPCTAERFPPLRPRKLPARGHRLPRSPLPRFSLLR